MIMSTSSISASSQQLVRKRVILENFKNDALTIEITFFTHTTHDLDVIFTKSTVSGEKVTVLLSQQMKINHPALTEGRC